MYIFQKLFWPFTVQINCSSDLKKFSNSRSLASSFFRNFFFITRTIFLTVFQNNLISSNEMFSISGQFWIWHQIQLIFMWRGLKKRKAFRGNIKALEIYRLDITMQPLSHQIFFGILLLWLVQKGSVIYLARVAHWTKTNIFFL